MAHCGFVIAKTLASFEVKFGNTKLCKRSRSVENFTILFNCQITHRLDISILQMLQEYTQFF